LSGTDNVVGSEAFAGGAKTGNVEDAVFGRDFLQRQRNQIRTEEVLPEIVVGSRVGKVNIRPDNQAFAFQVGGTLQPLKELEAKDNRRFDLRVEGIDKTDVSIDSGVAVSGRGDRGDGENIYSGGAEMGAYR
jgi:hypothetical protein